MHQGKKTRRKLNQNGRSGISLLIFVSKLMQFSYFLAPIQTKTHVHNQVRKVTDLNKMQVHPIIWRQRNLIEKEEP